MSSRKERDARLAAVRSALTKYFLGSVTTSDKFWCTNNPCLGNKSPEKMVRAGKIKAVEQYVTYLVKHVRSVRPKLTEKPVGDSFHVLEGTREEVLEKMKALPANHGVISIMFQNAESYCTYGPIVRQMANQLPEIVPRVLRRHEMLCARLMFSFTADLPVTFPKLGTPAQRAQRGASRKLAALGGTMPNSPEILRRRVPRE
jgi:hypothetical protein